MTNDDFENYSSDCISMEELNRLLDFFKKQRVGQPFLNFTVEDSGDGLVTGASRKN